MIISKYKIGDLVTFTYCWDGKPVKGIVFKIEKARKGYEQNDEVCDGDEGIKVWAIWHNFDGKQETQRLFFWEGTEDITIISRRKEKNNV